MLLSRDEAREPHAVLRAARTGAADARERSRLHALAARLHHPGPSAGDGAVPVHLSGRELDVLALVAVGHANGEVAVHLGITARGLGLPV